VSVPGRASRTASRRRRRGVVTAAVVALLGVGGFLVVAILGGNEAPGGASADAASDQPRGEPADLLALAVTGGDLPVVAVVGGGQGRRPEALVLPSEMTVVVPGQGEVLMGAAAALPGASMHVAVSNVVGTWTQGYATLDLRGLAALADAAGGLTVDVPEAVTIAGLQLGPGRTEMTGAQTAAYVGAPSDATTQRWAAVLGALLAAAPSLEDVEMDTGDAEGAAAIWAEAAGASVTVPATEIVAGSVSVAPQPELDEMIGELFGTPAPIPALIQNGSGAPGVGEDVAALLIPQGFRIVLSTNAESFDNERTEVVAIGQEHRADARLVHELLGVGVMRVSQVPSGLADVTIVVGKDFQA
jgi:hypothetical protein